MAPIRFSIYLKNVTFLIFCILLIEKHYFRSIKFSQKWKKVIYPNTLHY